MLIVPAWYGLGTSEMVRAEEAAAQGYVAMGIDFYGKGIRATSPGEAGALKGAVDADVDLINTLVRGAYEQLLPGGALEMAGGPMIDTENVFMIGYCAGGFYTMEYARSGAMLKGVAIFHSSFANSTAYPDMSHLGVQVHHAQLDFAEDDFSLIELEHKLDAAKTMTWETIKYSGMEHGFTDINGGAYNERAGTQAHASMFSFFKGLMPEFAVPTCEPGWYKNGDPSKNCAWVAEYAEKRCDAKGWDKSLAMDSCPCTCMEMRRNKK